MGRCKCVGWTAGKYEQLPTAEYPHTAGWSDRCGNACGYSVPVPCRPLRGKEVTDDK